MYCSIILTFSNICVLLTFFGVFSGDFGFSIEIPIKIHIYISTLSELWQVDHLTVANAGAPSVKFSHPS